VESIVSSTTPTTTNLAALLEVEERWWQHLLFFFSGLDRLFLLKEEESFCLAAVSYSKQRKCSR
jgi:hypothetical protein